MYNTTFRHNNMPSKLQRRLSRSRQSQRDRIDYYYQLGRDLSDPLSEYRAFLANCQAAIALHFNHSTKAFIKIPPNMIDLTACIISGLLTRRKNYLKIVKEDQLYKQIVLILSRTGICLTSFLMALLYCIRSDAKARHQLNAFEFYVSAIIVADKYLYDATLTNKDWVSFLDYKYTLQELNLMERVFLSQLDFQLYVTHQEFDEFIAFLDMTLCLVQISRWRSWSFSYADLMHSSLKLDTHFKHSYLSKLLGPMDIARLLISQLMPMMIFYMGLILGLIGLFKVLLHYT